MDPLPFRLLVPGLDEIDGLDVTSISVKVEGLAHWSNGILLVGQFYDQPTGRWSVPRRSTSTKSRSAKCAATWSSPRRWPSTFRSTSSPGRPSPGVGGASGSSFGARYVDAFANLPGAKPGRVEVRVKWRDRALARQLATALESAITNHQLATAAERRAIGPDR